MPSSKRTRRAAKKPAPRKPRKRINNKKRIGRPSKYLPIFAEQAKLLCERGATDSELADFFRVSITTVRTWQALHPEFLAAVRVGKESADDRVERSLYQRAVGYTFDTVTIFAPTSLRNAAVIEHREHCPPDVGAQKLWLTNRRREAWRERSELTGKDGAPLVPPPQELSEFDLARRVAFVFAEAERKLKEQTNGG